MTVEETQPAQIGGIPIFGVRKRARELLREVKLLSAERDKLRQQLEKFSTMAPALVAEVKQLRSERDTMLEQMKKSGTYSLYELERYRSELEEQVARQQQQLSREKAEGEKAWEEAKCKVEQARTLIVELQDEAVLQEVGVYRYRHPLSDAVSYQDRLKSIQARINSMVRKDGGAILATTDWTVNGSAAEGRRMVSDFSKLMLRAFNAEADTLVRGLKPYKLDAALERLKKVSEVIERLGRTMKIQISSGYLQLRLQELELTADFLQKQAEEKAAEREERERLREERKAQAEIERERERLEKERQHYANALDVLVSNGDEEGAARIREQLNDVHKAIETMDYRAANIRAGYVYVVSNVGSFGERMVKIGMTRRLDPMERVHELGDASVPFRFDVHALFFSKDAVGIESALHDRLGDARVNLINRRREFFRVSPLDVKPLLSELAGELLEFREIPEALEYRQSLKSNSVGEHSTR